MATNETTTSPSRRSVAAMLAAAAAVIPAAVIPKTATAGEPSADAELLELGRQFRALLPAEYAARAELERLADICDKRLAELFPENERRDLEWEKIEEFHATDKALRDETGRSAAYDVWTDKHEPVEQVTRAIKMTPARTLTWALGES
jgi:hypothetical protein